MRFLPLCLALLFAVAPPARAEDFHVYAASRATNQFWIVKAEPGDGGALTLGVAEKIDLGFPGSTIAAHPGKPLLYLAAPFGDENGNPGTTIELDDSGRFLRQHRVDHPNGYAYLSLDRANRFLLGSNYRGGQVDVIALDENGFPGKRVAGLDEGRKNAHCVLTSPDNRFVYVPYVKDTNELYQYRFDPETGALTPLDPRSAGPPAGTGPRHLAYHPTLPIVYFSNEQHLGISVYEKEDSGQLRLRQVCDAVGEEEPKDGVSSSDIAITPDGRFLFAGIRGHERDFDWVSRYRIEPDGTVELLGLTPADKIPWGFTLSPDGRHLLVSAHTGATLTAYLIGGDGGLTKVASLAWDPEITDLVTRGIAGSPGRE